ncbi:MAG: hypothetical protein KBT75_15255, partial [Oleispira antarctica]|nr:hypothetical protein [Oleispira antarctica]
MRIALAKYVLRTVFLIFLCLPSLYGHTETPSFDDEDTEFEGDSETDSDDDEGFYYEDAFSDREYTDTRPF